MNDKNKRKLDEITGHISKSIEKSEGSGGYAYSSSLTTPRARQIAGLWKVIEHVDDGVPYAEAFARSTFRGAEHSPLSYDATYEFSGNTCVKRVMLHGTVLSDGRNADFEYRMSAVLTWEIGPDVISARPILGYQITSIDGAPASVRELPNAVAGIIIQYALDGDALTLTDGSDVKRLARIPS